MQRQKLKDQEHEKERESQLKTRMREQLQNNLQEIAGLVEKQTSKRSKSTVRGNDALPSLGGDSESFRYGKRSNAGITPSLDGSIIESNYNKTDLFQRSHL